MLSGPALLILPVMGPAAGFAEGGCALGFAAAVLTSGAAPAEFATAGAAFCVGSHVATDPTGLVVIVPMSFGVTAAQGSALLPEGATSSPV